MVYCLAKGVRAIDFKALTADSALQPYFSMNPGRTCDYVYGTLLMWRSYFHISYAVTDEGILIRLDHYDGAPAYLCPTGPHARSILCRLASEDPSPRFCFVPEDALPLLRSVFPTATVTEEPDWFDYLHRADELYAMAGQKFHGPKNHVNKFLRLYPDATFTLSPDMEALRAFFARLAAESEKDDPMALAEHQILSDMMDFPESYGMIWGVLTVEGSIVAASAAEILGDTMYVHAEKADTRYPGAYQTVARAMAGLAAERGAIYLNREEDLGDPGLRRAKQGYRPVALLKKYTVCV